MASRPSQCYTSSSFSRYPSLQARCLFSSRTVSRSAHNILSTLCAWSSFVAQFGSPGFETSLGCSLQCNSYLVCLAVHSALIYNILARCPRYGFGAPVRRHRCDVRRMGEGTWRDLCPLPRDILLRHRVHHSCRRSRLGRKSGLYWPPAPRLVD